MPNYAAVIAPLAISGSRKSDGTPNDSGQVWFYRLGTTSPVNVYADAAATQIVSAPVTLDNGGRISASDYPDGIFITQPIRLLIQASDNTVVSDTDYVPSTAGATGMSNDGMSGTTVDWMGTAALASFGGQDFLVKSSAGETARTVKSKFSEIWVSVVDFGADPTGIAVSTTAVQAAFNRVKALGGGTVYFPPGTYKIDQAIVLTSATGVSVVGSGIDASIISSTNATANGFTFSSCNGLTLEGFRVTHATSSTGRAVSIASSSGVSVVRVASYAGTSTGVFRYGMYLDTVDSATIHSAKFVAPAADASGRGMFMGDSSLIRAFGSNFSAATGYGLEFSGSTFTASFYACTGHTPHFALGLTGTLFDFYGCNFSSYSVATATIPIIRTFGGAIQASATSSAVGAAQTPSLIAGDEVVLAATSGGAGTVTVNAPAVLPPVSLEAANLYWDFVFKNASGGAVTWTLNAVFVVTAAIPTTAAHTISVRFRWDYTTSKLREVSRADTVT